MPALESNLELRRSEIVVGESFPLRITFRNPGAAPVEVPNRLGPDELDFVLRRANETNVFVVLNALGAQVQRSADPIRVAVPNKDRLAPGAAATYDVDPANYLLEPLAPGAYTLSVAFGAGPARFESKGIPLKVLPPAFDALAVVAQPASQRIGWCIAHTDARKNTAMLVSVSPMGQSRVGVLDRVAEAAAPLTIGGVAAALELEETIGETWVSWLQGDTLVAGIHAGGEFNFKTEAPSLGLKQPMLQSVGWRLAPDSASFAVLGLDSGNRPSLVLVGFTRDAAPVIKRFAVDTKLPLALWRVGYRNGAQGPQWMLVFAEREGNGSCIRCQRIPAAADAAKPGVTLLDHIGPVVAMGFSPVDTASNVVDILIGPSNPPKMKLVRLSADTTATLIGQWEVPMTSVSGAALPAWSIADYFLDDPIVLAKDGARLLSRRASGGDWKVLADQAATAQHAQIVSIGGQPWAAWSDRTVGLRLQLIR